MAAAAVGVFLGNYMSDANRMDADDCLKAGSPDKAETGVQKSILGLFNRARESETGDRMMDVAAEKDIKICFDSNMSKNSTPGYITLGEFDVGRNRIRINPESPEDPYKRTKTLLHELRHSEQYEFGKNPSSWGNYKETDRIALLWLEEADARLRSLLYAYEMEQQGNTAYMEQLRLDNNHRYMAEGFINSLEEKPDDFPAAMRAAIRAFSNDSNMMCSYSNGIAKWIEDSGRDFNPVRGRKELLSDKMLLTVGYVDGYGQYMNEEFMDFIRNSISDEYYKKIKSARSKGTSVFSQCGGSTERPYFIL
jgi:hypothetical protein